VNTLTEGDYFGEVALMQDEPRTATLRTTVNTELYRLDRTTLATLIENAPSVRDSLLHTMDARRAALHDMPRRVAT
jgi:CRP-like cAMP-binding protein